MTDNPITMSPDNIPETTLWIGMYRDAMQVIVARQLDTNDLGQTPPEFAAAAADVAVLEFRKRTKPAHGAITLEDTMDGEPKFG